MRNSASIRPVIAFPAIDMQLKPLRGRVPWGTSLWRSKVMRRGTLDIVGPRCWFLVFALFCLTISGPARADKRVALVIGNSAYVNVPRLTNPANDARLMADTLRSLGFTLVGGAAQLDLDKTHFDRAVEDFGNQLQGADVGLFYYAGHGLQVRGANYLVPTGANPTKEADIDFQMLDSNLVLRQMESAGTKLNLVILDACRNNPFGGRGLRATDAGLAQMRAPEGTLISFATQPGNVAQDGGDGNSPYTKALAQAMHRPGLDVFRTFNEVGLAVSSVTGGAQQPWVSLSPIKGDFYFAGAPANVTNTRPSVDPCALAGEHWRSTEVINTRAAYEDHLARFPNCPFAGLARARIETLNKVAVTRPEPFIAPAQTPETVQPKILASRNPNDVGVNPRLPVKLGDTYEQVKSTYRTSRALVPVSGTVNSDLDFKELGIRYVFNPAKTVLSIGLSAPFAGSVAGVMVGDTKAQIDAVWSQPTQNYNNFMVYYAYRGQKFEVIYDSNLKSTTIYLDR
jgi:hypothetical protein